MAYLSSPEDDPTKEVLEEFGKIKGSKLIKKVVEAEDPEKEEHCTAVNLLVREALETYEHGEEDFSKTIKGLTEALNAYAAWEERETPEEEKKAHGRPVKK